MIYQTYFASIRTNSDRPTVPDIGPTNGLQRPGKEHSLGWGSQFARQDSAHKLLYFEAYPDPTSAIAQEKRPKNWSRKKKEALIAEASPEWRDLIAEIDPVSAHGGTR